MPEEGCVKFKDEMLRLVCLIKISQGCFFSQAAKMIALKVDMFGCIVNYWNSKTILLSINHTGKVKGKPGSKEKKREKAEGKERKSR